ncbi:MAG: zinc metallopeptidase [Thermonemataceae bacterium]|nr:zinc metallopeptidase [Thermonemataceae bacterium]
MTFYIILGLTFLASWLVSSRLKSKFRKYSQIRLKSDLTGKEAAEQMLRDYGIYNVSVTCVPGELTDHYNPSNKTVNLSEAVYYSNSAAAVAVAAHECGHAVQHAKAYSMLEFRSMMVPVQNISANILNIIMMLSFIGGTALYRTFPIELVLLVIIGAYGVITLFSLVTLPVEFDASKRALAWIQQKGVAVGQEYAMSKDALFWAAMTYVVAALGSIAMLMYYVLQFLGISRDDD